jgi:hypothetical protein
MQRTINSIVSQYINFGKISGERQVGLQPFLRIVKSLLACVSRINFCEIIAARCNRYPIRRLQCNCRLVAAQAFV